ncbi:MAG: hypothetical protein Q7J82_06295 [Coriobacteriia bacterium]|nr:hypothetical protein [Coriobacteriia bacterium]
MAERRSWLDVLKGAAMVLVVVNHAIIWPMRAGDGASAFLYGTAYGTVAAFSAVTGYIGGLRLPGRFCGWPTCWEFRAGGPRLRSLRTRVVCPLEAV